MMNSHLLTKHRAVVVCLLAAGVIRANAELPSIDDPKWVGVFAGMENHKMRFEFDTKGRAKIKVLEKNGEFVEERFHILIDFVIEETLPDGQVIEQKILPETLSSELKPHKKLGVTLIKGKTTGGSEMTIRLTNDRGFLTLGGWWFGPGGNSNARRFVVHFRTPNAHPDGPGSSQNELKDFERELSKDKLKLIRTNNERVTIEASKPIDSTYSRLSGAQFELYPFPDAKFILDASSNGIMKLTGNSGKPLHEGMTFSWMENPGKEQFHKEARLAIQIK